MKVCPNCNHSNMDSASFCTTCGMDLTNTPVQPEPIQTVPSAPQVMPPVTVYQPKEQEPYSWPDVCAIIGFISSLVGLFWCSVVLLPVGVIFSLLGFMGHRTRGLAIAGLTISLIGTLIKVCVVMTQSNLLPDWVVKGIFNA